MDGFFSEDNWKKQPNYPEKQICILQISGDAPLNWKMKEKKYYITGKIPSIDSGKMKKREFPMNNRKNYLYIP